MIIFKRRNCGERPSGFVYASACFSFSSWVIVYCIIQCRLGWEKGLVQYFIFISGQGLGAANAFSLISYF